ncbi:UNVERIFIED_CONTAM: hypothetical protein FKN15_051506 [Acipenser sinensis]
MGLWKNTFPRGIFLKAAEMLVGGLFSRRKHYPTLMNYENPPPYAGPGPSAPGYPPYTQQPNPAYPGPNPAYPGPGVNQAYPNYPPGSGVPYQGPYPGPGGPYAGPGQPGYPGYPQYAPQPGQVYGDAPKNTGQSTVLCTLFLDIAISR